MLIKCKFIKNGNPVGRAYTYQSKWDFEVGDEVSLPGGAHGIVTEINVPEEKVAYVGQVKNVIGKMETRVIFKNWSVYSVPQNDYQPPELQPKYLQGNVYGHQTFEDGKYIHTGLIETILDHEDHKEVVTLTGSRYLVYPQDVDTEAENRYPGYYSRLRMIGGTIKC